MLSPVAVIVRSTAFLASAMKLGLPDSRPCDCQGPMKRWDYSRRARDSTRGAGTSNRSTHEARWLEAAGSPNHFCSSLERGGRREKRARRPRYMCAATGFSVSLFMRKERLKTKERCQASLETNPSHSARFETLRRVAELTAQRISTRAWNAHGISRGLSLEERLKTSTKAADSIATRSIDNGDADWRTKGSPW